MPRISKAPDERRNELIAVAQHLFFTKGFDKTSVGEIVKTADVAKGLFYYYFDSKQAVLEAMIDGLLSEEQALIQQVMADDSLDAITKWQQTMQILAAWEVANANEILPLLRTMYKPENVRFLHHMQTQSTLVFAPEITKLITQGVSEGVFTVAHATETAEIVMRILLHTLDPIANIMLDLQAHPDAMEKIGRLIFSSETAIARVLGADPDLLSTNTLALLDQWSQDQS